MKKIILLLSLVLMSMTVSAQSDSLDAKYGKNLLKAGSVAPDFKLLTADKKEISLSDFRGSYVVLDFWASWCPDCRKDIPEMKTLFNEFGDQKVRFVGISFDTDRDAWINAYWTTYRMNWTQVSELKRWKHGTTIDRLYHVDWIPTMYLIDPEGRVVFGTVDINRLRESLQELAPKTLTMEEVVALFPDGKEGLGKFLDANRFYPPICRKYKATARVVCRFTTSFDGKVSGARVVRVEDFVIQNTKKFNKLSPERQAEVSEKCLAELKDEAVREVNRMPNWKPATHNGRLVQAQYLIPIEF